MLRWRRVECVTTGRLCNVDDETGAHVFFTCNVAKECWRRLGVNVENHAIHTFSMGFQALRNSLEEDGLCFGLVLCWGMWQCRNAAVWRGEAVSVAKIFTLAQSFWQGWRHAHEIGTEGVVAGVVVQRWQRPMLERCKLNVDAAFNGYNGRAGFGWVLRDAHGAFLAAMAAPYGVAEDARMAEALGVREALSWLKEIGVQRVDVEIDAQEFFHAVRGEPGESYFDLVIDDIKDIASTIVDLQFLFVKRSGNQVANRIARESGSMTDRVSWFYIPPVFIVSLLISNNES
ncbi:PREDICTED: uncharacterized protein LOC109157746 [Ipomoea nil]|uniref:uncharacterized protein LOC109157746 n=1 Tax=Ipomoea nil TaxID=35883 RepID=UPI000900C8AD|nr:PREDICTED: uncharacterized protein LOC109157746 [Ipomoea nil]